MKIKTFVFLSFFTILSTISLSFNPHIKYFHASPAAAEEINDPPQTLEDAEKLIENLPRTRVPHGYGSSYRVQSIDLENPQYIKIKLDAIEDLKKALPIYKEYGNKVMEEWVSSQICTEYLEIGHLVNIGKEYFRYCQNPNSHIDLDNIQFFIELAKNSGKYNEAIKEIQEKIDWQKEYLNNHT
jgi:hypothetical protein